MCNKTTIKKAPVRAPPVSLRRVSPCRCAAAALTVFGAVAPAEAVETAVVRASGEAVNPAAPPTSADEVTVVGRRPPPSRGASDFRVEIGALAAVPRRRGADLLQLAPWVFLTSEGGQGHPERIYLRGFDAREGQDIELSVGGVPINESGNLHGNGFADLHFILPELVRSIRVLEGPFDPRQGNYAVAGSAEYELGLERRGLTTKYSLGSFGTHRLLLLWGPAATSPHTFGGAEIQTTEGFGQNRDARRATAMGQYEGALGERGSFRVGAAAYAAEYHSAGLLREDDVRRGRKGFFDTYDLGQGGGGSRFHVSGDVDTHAAGAHLHQQVFAVFRGMRLRENFTGFLLDTQQANQRPHGQRGDLLDLDMTEATFGARGFARVAREAFGARQEFELGFFARGDHARGVRQRIDAAAGVPYRTEIDLESKLADIGLHVDTTLRAFPWLAVRGGVRADLFAFNVLDRCAVRGVSRPSEIDPPIDESCLDQQRFGVHREPTQRSSTASVKAMPRASLLVGPVRHITFSLSYGEGVRSIDPSYITQDVKTPFAGIRAYDGGVAYVRSWDSLVVRAQSVLFVTHVDRDLVFSETEGRNVIGGGTTRAGWAGALRLTGDCFDESASATLVRSSFDDTGLLVPYVPDLVIRSDSALRARGSCGDSGAEPAGLQ
jgi:iron complex outermembrane recepter protein